MQALSCMIFYHWDTGCRWRSGHARLCDRLGSDLTITEPTDCMRLGALLVPALKFHFLSATWRLHLLNFTKNMRLPEFKFRRETLWPFLLAGTITWCSGHSATLPEVEWIIPIDKLGHWGLYGALATSMVRHPALGRWPWLKFWWAFPLASAYGLGDEFRQSLTQGIRHYDLLDWAADTAGAATAVVLYLKWGAYRWLMEMPLRRPHPPVAINAEPTPTPADVAR